MFRRLSEAPANLTIVVDGAPVRAAPGETVAAALLAAGIGAFRLTPRTGAPRGLYCGMGACFDCLVTIDGAHNQQACLAIVAEGMTVDTGARLPAVAPAPRG
jgi:predicted molibdopterin-dependent oxidoreductase YjgC